MLLPATFGVLIGWEKRFDPEFLQSDVTGPAQSHNCAEQAKIEISLAYVNRKQKIAGTRRCLRMACRRGADVAPDFCQQSSANRVFR